MTPNAFAPVFNKELEKYFIEKRGKSESLGTRAITLIDQITDISLRGGGRLRPYLCYVGYLWNKDRNYREIVPVLISLELTQSFFLIHDDVMDEAVVRRGGPTIHAYFTQNLRKGSKSSQIAQSLAILAGDLCSIWSEEVWSRLPKGTFRASAWNTFHQMRQEVAMGQLEDVWGMKGESVAKIIQMYAAKSGNYSVEKPLVIGAQLSDAPVKVIQALSQFGKLAGVAFQLQDDILGVFGDEKTTGKSASTDIVEGKWTPLIAHTYELLKSTQRRKLLKQLGNKRSDQNDLQWIREQIISTGARSKVEKQKHDLINRAKKALETAPQHLRNTLSQLADTLVNRSS